MRVGLSEVPQLTAADEVPISLVDLIPVVTRSRSEGMDRAFGWVLKALKESYPQLRGVPPSELAQAMQGLVDKREMGADVAASVRQLQELLEMPEWKSDQAGDTSHELAFLMLAEGAIHQILRTAQHRATGKNGRRPGSTAVSPVLPSWRGRYGDRFPVELHILRWNGSQFTGIMLYPDDDTATSVSGQADRQPGTTSVSLSWQEHSARRPIDFNGSYTATLDSDEMKAGWHQGEHPRDEPLVEFRMTPVYDTNASK
jgi:hypothetical protein